MTSRRAKFFLRGTYNLGLNALHRLTIRRPYTINLTLQKRQALHVTRDLMLKRLPECLPDEAKPEDWMASRVNEHNCP